MFSTPVTHRKKTAVAIAALCTLSATSSVHADGVAPDGSDCYSKANGDWDSIQLQSSKWLCYTNNGSTNSAYPGLYSRAQIDSSYIITVVNNMYVNALRNGGSLNIQPGGTLVLGGNGTTSNSNNSNTINIGGGTANATLVVGGNGTTFSNTGTINVGQRGVLFIPVGGIIKGGTINTTDNGYLTAFRDAGGIIDGVTVNGYINLSKETARLTVVNSLTLNGKLEIDANSSLEIAAPNGTTTITTSQGQTGSIVFGSSPDSNRIHLAVNAVAYIDPNITIQGKNGNILGSGGGEFLVNSGNISANVAGGTIFIDLRNGMNNDGRMGAANGGTLYLAHTPIYNTGIISAQNGSVIFQQDSQIYGGTITTDSTSSLRGYLSPVNSLTNVTLNGTLDLATDTSSETINSGLVLNGSVKISNNSVLTFSNTQTLSTTSSGEIQFGKNLAQNNVIAIAPNSTLTIGPNILVHGGNGAFTSTRNNDATPSFINNGQIIADIAGGVIYVNSQYGKAVNAGLLSAANNGTLVLRGLLSGTASGQISAASGNVIQSSGNLSGIINVVAGAIQVDSNSNNTLYALKLTGNLDMATNFGYEKVYSGLVLNGNIKINNNSILSFNGDQSLTTTGGPGTAYITFGNTGVYNQLALANQTTLTIGPNVVIHGENGTVGATDGSGATQVLVNNGLISADVQGGEIHLAAVNGTINNGILEARNGATLVLDTHVIGAVGNPLSKVLAADRSTVLQNGMTIIGNVATTGTGSVKVSNVVSNFLQSVTLSGTLDLASGFERVRQGLVLNGATVKMDSSVLSFGGDQSLSGTGTVELGSPASVGPNTLGLEGDTTLTIGAGVLVHGRRGYIGDTFFSNGQQSIINNGTVNSDGNDVISIGVSGSLTNNGLLRAQSGSLNLQTAVSGSGTLQVDPTGAITLANRANQQGTLIMGAAGSTLNIGTQNLTIDKDYTNAAWGSGNAFVKRAGIVGTGQIVAGGAAAQVIAGAQISNGAAAVATLTIGNVRLGSTALNYQIINGSSSGPILRGALQTAVNGANVSDARLSGAGLSAGSYATGTTGAISFSALTAGVLTPLTGQALNLRSSFDNIADQKLNIVVASGAAAYNVAGAGAIAPVVIHQRIGNAATTALAISNVAVAGLFSEALNASISSTTGAATSVGAVSGLTAGGTDNATLRVGLNSASAGAKSGSVTVAFQSDGTGTTGRSGLSAINAGSQVVNVSGNVYTSAVARVNTTTVDFGIVHVGDAATPRNVSFSNIAAQSALNDTLSGSISSASAPFLASGTSSNLAAQSSNSTSLSVGLNTAQAGVFGGSATASFASHNKDMSDLALTSTGIALKAQVNNYAQAAITTAGYGKLTASNNTYTLDFGSFALGSGNHNASLSVLNNAFGPADLLSGTFDLSGAGAGFDLTGFGTFANLVGGGTMSGMAISFSSGVAGSFQKTLVLHARGSNESGYSQMLDDKVLTIVGSVAGSVGMVPEPATYALMIAGLVGLAGAARARRKRQQPVAI